jgi:hypothetical protein
MHCDRREKCACIHQLGSVFRYSFHRCCAKHEVARVTQRKWRTKNLRVSEFSGPSFPISNEGSSNWQCFQIPSCAEAGKSDGEPDLASQELGWELRFPFSLLLMFRIFKLSIRANTNGKHNCPTQRLASNILRRGGLAHTCTLVQ